MKSHLGRAYAPSGSHSGTFTGVGSGAEGKRRSTFIGLGRRLRLAIQHPNWFGSW